MQPLPYFRNKDWAVYPGLEHILSVLGTYTSAGTYIWIILIESTHVYNLEMGKLQVVSSLEDETDQPPGTFKLIRGEAPSLSWVGVFIDSHPVLDDEADEHGQHSVVRDPILSSDPNEPLVSQHSIQPWYLPIYELIPAYIHG